MRPRFEVADVVRCYGDDYRRLHAPSSAQDVVLRRIAACRTAAMGGHLDQCDACGHQRISYNSCRNRNCPKCQSLASTQWVSDRLDRMLPIPHFHVVFTIPDELNPLALRNPAVVYNLLFAAASATLLTIARDEKHLGAQIGFTMVLHTWGQRLVLHPHVHAIVTSGGLALDGQSWVPTRENFLLPVKVLSKVFRGKFLAGLEAARDEGRLDFAGSTADLAKSRPWKRLKSSLYRKDWVVYAKQPFGGLEHVLRYLGRYTHRIAISNHRLVDVADGRVIFTWKDYAAGCAIKHQTLDAVEFLRRFLLHVLPSGFVRIRHYGLCASGNVATKLALARRLLDTTLPTAVPPTLPNPPPAALPWWERLLAQTGVDVMICPCCGGRLWRRGPLTSDQIARRQQHVTAEIDSS